MSILVPRPLSFNVCMPKKSLRESMLPIGDHLVERLRDNFPRNSDAISDFSKHSELGDLLKLEVQNEFRLTRQLE